MKPILRKILRAALFTVLIVFVGIQFVRPERTNPAIQPELTLESHLKPPPGVARLIDVACNDCHSDATRWPWYSNVAPISWLVAHDVSEGREHMNFSRFGDLRADKRAKILEEAAEEIAEGAMPLSIYGLTHPEARLTADQRRELSAWFSSAAGPRGSRDRDGAKDDDDRR